MARLRRKGNFTRPAETRGKFNDGGRTIKKRPKDVYKRKELGHWEGDTVVSGKIDRKCKSSACFVTLAERKSRMYIAIKVPNRTAEIVSQAIIKALKDFPEDMVKTITFDRGKEIAGYEDIENALHCSTYFCDPYCVWQKGTNENTNGLLREFYPKGMDLSLVDEDELKHNLELMNNRPRKCLGYKTPNEVMNEIEPRIFNRRMIVRMMAISFLIRERLLLLFVVNPSFPNDLPDSRASVLFLQTFSGSSGIFPPACSLSTTSVGTPVFDQ